MNGSTVYVILPAYNEEHSLKQLFPALEKTLQAVGRPYWICLVDDGSRDGTAAVVAEFKRLPLEYLRHSKNQGYGAALRSGFRWVIQNAQPNDVAVSLDSDNSHLPEYIPRLLAKLEEGYDVVTASYSGGEGRSIGVPLIRKIYSRVVNLLLRLRFRLPGARTYTNGFRAYRVSALQKASARWQDRLIESTNFAGGTELFIKVARCGARLAEIPFTLHYENRLGASKINIPRTVAGYLKLLQ